MKIIKETTCLNVDHKVENLRYYEKSHPRGGLQYQLPLEAP